MHLCSFVSISDDVLLHYSISDTINFTSLTYFCIVLGSIPLVLEAQQEPQCYITDSRSFFSNIEISETWNNKIFRELTLSFRMDFNPMISTCLQQKLAWTHINLLC